MIFVARLVCHALFCRFFCCVIRIAWCFFCFSYHAFCTSLISGTKKIAPVKGRRASPRYHPNSRAERHRHFFLQTDALRLRQRLRTPEARASPLRLRKEISHTHTYRGRLTADDRRSLLGYADYLLSSTPLIHFNWLYHTARKIASIFCGKESIICKNDGFYIVLTIKIYVFCISVHYMPGVKFSGRRVYSANLRIHNHRRNIFLQILLLHFQRLLRSVAPLPQVPKWIPEQHLTFLYMGLRVRSRLLAAPSVFCLWFG